jgi:hypothetical protein
MFGVDHARHMFGDVARRCPIASRGRESAPPTAGWLPGWSGVSQRTDSGDRRARWRRCAFAFGAALVLALALVNPRSRGARIVFPGAGRWPDYYDSVLRRRTRQRFHVWLGPARQPCSVCDRLSEEATLDFRVNVVPE